MGTRILPLLGVSQRLERSSLTYAGLRLSLPEWAKWLQIPVGTLYARLRKARSMPTTFREGVEQVLITPLATSPCKQTRLMQMLMLRQDRLTRAKLVRRPTRWPTEARRTIKESLGTDEKITHGGITLTAQQWAVKLNMPMSNLIGVNARPVRSELLDRYLVRATYRQEITK